MSYHENFFNLNLFEQEDFLWKYRDYIKECGDRMSLISWYTEYCLHKIAIGETRKGEQSNITAERSPEKVKSEQRPTLTTRSKLHHKEPLDDKSVQSPK